MRSNGGASPALGDERLGDYETREPRCFGFLGQWRGREESLSGREAAGPAVPAKERGNSRTEKRAVLILEVGASARRNGKPTGDLDIVLHEHARRRVPVRELRYVARKIDVPLSGNADHPGVAMKRAARGEFAEQQFVAIAFADVTEAVIMILQGRGESGGDDVALLDDLLKIAADVIAAGVQSLGVGRAGRR